MLTDKERRFYAQASRYPRLITAVLAFGEMAMLFVLVANIVVVHRVAHSAGITLQGVLHLAKVAASNRVPVGHDFTGQEVAIIRGICGLFFYGAFTFLFTLQILVVRVIYRGRRRVWSHIQELEAQLGRNVDS